MNIYSLPANFALPLGKYILEADIGEGQPLIEEFEVAASDGPVDVVIQIPPSKPAVRSDSNVP